MSTRLLTTKRRILLGFALLFLITGFALPVQAFAQAICNRTAFGCFEVISTFFGVESVGFVASFPNPTIILVQKIANFTTGAIVAIGVIMIIIGGYFYMTAGGNAEQVSKAKKFIVAAIGGIALALVAVTILNTISPQFADKATDPQCGATRLIVLRVFEIDYQLGQGGISNEGRNQLNNEKRELQRELGRLYNFCPRVNVDNPFR